MGLNELCRKCSRVVSSRTVLLSTRAGDEDNCGASVWYMIDENEDESEHSSLELSSDEQVGLLRRIVEYENLEERSLNLLSPGERLLFHHSATSLEDDCHLCQLLKNELRGILPKDLSGKEAAKCRLIPLILTLMEPDGSISSRDLVFWAIRDGVLHPLDYRTLRMTTRVSETLGQSDASCGSPLKQSTRSRILQWLKSCEMHASCKRVDGYVPFGASNLPTRLLQILGTPSGLIIRLVENDALLTTASRPLYATLSHCWGKARPSLRLLKENVCSFESGISLDSVPPTFQDAVNVTVALGIRYLWIDALCIIQDSPSDWQSEASRMLNIYSRGVFNISAVAALDSDSGFLKQNNFLTSCVADVGWKVPSLPSGKVRIASSSSNYTSVINNSRLNGRGWVLQERLLSPRTIFFAADQVWWQCRSTLHNEFGRPSMQESEVLYRYDLLKSGPWMKLVQLYGRTQLTYSTDRLVAFSGIAEAFALKQRYAPADYLAGLWRPRLFDDLVWVQKASYLGGSIAEQPSEYVAPSWSWASVVGEVVVFTVSKDYPSLGYRVLGVQWRQNLQVLDTRIDLKAESSFGPITGAFLAVKVSLHPVKFSDRSDIDEAREHPGLFLRLELGNQSLVRADDLIKCSWQATRSPVFLFYRDGGWASLERSVRCLSAYFMPVFCRTVSWYEGEPHARQGKDYFGLVVTRVLGRRATYRRIGVLRISSSDPRWTPAWWTTGSPLRRDEFLEWYSHRMYKIKIV